MRGQVEVDVEVRTVSCGLAVPHGRSEQHIVSGHAEMEELCSDAESMKPEFEQAEGNKTGKMSKEIRKRRALAFAIVICWS